MKKLFAAIAALFLGFSVFSAQAQVAHPFWVQGDFGTAFVQEGRANQYVYGAEVGYIWNKYVRTGVEFLGLDMPQNGGGSKGSVNNYLLTTTLYGTYPMGYVTPFVGAGVGVSFNSGSGIGSSSGVGVLTAGLGWLLSERWEAVVQYKYILGFNETVWNSTGTKQDNLRTSTLMGSLRYKF